jgi:hypothetical protein
MRRCCNARWKQLPHATRSVLWLYHAEGYTHEEIAAAMQRSASFSKSQLARGTRRLRVLLQVSEPSADTHTYEEGAGACLMPAISKRAAHRRRTRSLGRCVRGTARRNTGGRWLGTPASRASLPARRCHACAGAGRRGWQPPLHWRW